MRTSLKLLAVATLMLPGCILVAKDGGWNSSDSRSKSSLEQRVAVLEAQIRHCQEEAEESACKCMSEKHDEGEKHAEPAGAH